MRNVSGNTAPWLRFGVALTPETVFWKSHVAVSGLYGTSEQLQVVCFGKSLWATLPKLQKTHLSHTEAPATPVPPVARCSARDAICGSIRELMTTRGLYSVISVANSSDGQSTSRTTGSHTARWSLSTVITVEKGFCQGKILLLYKYICSKLKERKVKNTFSGFSLVISL